MKPDGRRRGTQLDNGPNLVFDDPGPQDKTFVIGERSPPRHGDSLNVNVANRPRAAVEEVWAREVMGT